LYGAEPRLDRGVIAFAQGLAASAAAALRTAELFASVEKERARSTSEALRFGAVLDQMADAVVVVDARGRVERWSRAARELLGEDMRLVPIEEWPEQLALMTSDRRPLTAAEFPLARALHGERRVRASFILVRGPGEERHIACSAGPIRSPDGGRAGAAMVLRDVTDEQQYAEILRHTNRELRRQAEVLEDVNRQLRDATRAKDQFLAVMSHELRTPINAIMGYADLLDLGIKGELNRDQLEMVGRVRQTSRHLLGLINEVLDLAKIGSGHVDLAFEELDIADIVRLAAEQITPLATEKGLHFHVERDGGVAKVVGDRTRLTQVVINLLSNAVKFTDTGAVTIRYGGDGTRVRIRVRDTGPGIAPEQRDRIFEEFYQVDGTLSRAAGGTGLGLSIARRFTRLMGGDIWVRSEPGAGSEFIVDVPAAGSANEPDRDERARQAAGA
jgi:PAS domain S-box-containing protein